ncbi:helix-turn-helix domain-containing protein [Amycolatopsis regifaucium]|uniref:AraC family transcriptional regulator n=1 Tax=Amycolatopsis regifaucium TaxID=546365 RepID=A0A154MRH9_9PSEU|nr:helix-turn-helix domain-containing protein [Amycolatopsis regifaucium]KZB86049.1 AraC family transcriptional regulator [Amycolatopsis regifaucium]OKA04941.1 AraC family transcriptional regulator [Amycolatopsis regifaucium]SFH75988.1 AraC-type DNA-binding protein [Amycolatopsis regifaucium]
MGGWSLVVPRREIHRAPGERLLHLPHPAIAAHVSSYVAHDLPGTGPNSWQVTPLSVLTWVIDFEAPVRRSEAGGEIPDSPVLGLRDRPLVVEQAGVSRGISVALSPLGAAALFGIPLRELTNSVVAAAEVMPPGSLTERLAETADWPERFRLLDEYLVARLARGPALSAPVRYAWERLSAGQVRVDALADEIGWSRQHLNARFREQIGLNPKTVGRIARLNRTMALLNREPSLSWAEIAYLGGYSDQAHLTREFRALSGCTPTEIGKPTGLFVAGRLRA